MLAFWESSRNKSTALRAAFPQIRSETQDDPADRADEHAPHETGKRPALEVADEHANAAHDDGPEKNKVRADPAQECFQFVNRCRNIDDLALTGR